ncbi:MAG TPA: homoserine kinase [Chloroflexota bacterium]|nr:homoserine kinase [Chloroflexota bacterium]
MPPLAATVQVPATSANLGPGFDCLGLALNLYLRVSCQTGGDGLRIHASDPEIATDAGNLVFRAIEAAFEAAGQPVPALELDIDNGIPLSRGLGSSSAAIIGGVALANALLGEPFDRDRLLEIALPLEGHPDNIAPALFGGLAVSSVDGDRVLAVPVRLRRPPRIVLFIPDFKMSTAEARRVLPDSVPRADAIFNTGRSSLLVAALAAGDFSVLRWAMDDRLHQPYRGAIFPALPKLIEAALEAGAAGCAMSGAGSTVIAFCEGDTKDVAAAFGRAASAAHLNGRSAMAEIDTRGARLVRSPLPPTGGA